jgi:hypothetical protein
MSLAQDVGDRERGDMAIFAGRDAAGILAVYDAQAAGRAWPLCWPGLLFPLAWFLYRKMYLWAALVSAGPLLLAYAPMLSWASWSAAAIGAAGMRLYIDFARRTIRGIRAQAADAAEAEALLARAGGVSRIGAVVGVVFAFAQFVLSLKLGAPALFSPR